MKRIISLMLVIACGICFAMPGYASDLSSATDYNLAEKLQKQLWAGSGFQGTLTFEINANEGNDEQALTTKKPMVFDVSYIYARPTTSQAEEHRLDLTLMDSSAEQVKTNFQWMDNVLSFQSDLLGADWYSFGESKTQPEQTADETLDTALEQIKSEIFEQTGMPSVVDYLLSLLMTLQEEDTDGEELLNTYLTKIDLWIEGYRENAVLDKLEDGTSTMTTQYNIPASAIKTQTKQLVLDVLHDPNSLALLKELMDEKYVNMLLNQNMQNYYFSAIDFLPLTGDLTISRTVSLTGDTVELHLSMPVYDVKTGDVTIAYDRVAGQGDLPGENTVRIVSDSRETTLTFHEYSSMTDITVWQGTFTSRPIGVETFAVGDAQTTEDEIAQQIISVAFMLKQEIAEGKDEEKRDVYDYHANLTLAPNEENTFNEEILDFKLTEVAFNAHFVSKELKKAATEMQATLSIGGDEWAQNVLLTLDGKSRSKWDMEVLPTTRIDLGSMSKEDLEVFALGAALTIFYTMSYYISLPPVNPADGDPADSGLPTASESPAVSESPTASEATDPLESPVVSGTPEPYDATEPTESPVPSDSPEPSESPEPTAAPTSQLSGSH